MNRLCNLARSCPKLWLTALRKTLEAGVRKEAVYQPGVPQGPKKGAEIKAVGGLPGSLRISQETGRPMTR